MTGCPKCKLNKTTLMEECRISGEVTEGKVECDFGYESCELFKAAQAKKSRKTATEE